jgi:hypothetical protein
MTMLSSDPLLSGDTIQLDAIVKQVNKDPDVLYALVRDKSGALLTSQYASINYQHEGSKALLEKQPKERQVPDLVAALAAANQAVETELPVLSDNEKIGTVRLGEKFGRDFPEGFPDVCPVPDDTHGIGSGAFQFGKPAFHGLREVVNGGGQRGVELGVVRIVLADLIELRPDPHDVP